MSQDPLTAFVARSLRADVTDVRSEVVAKNTTLELERIRFRQEGEERSLVVKRVPPSDALEVQLLPLLARKTDRVPLVRSRGIPPPAVPAWPWVLTEDLLDAQSACHEDLARRARRARLGTRGRRPAAGCRGARRRDRSRESSGGAVSRRAGVRERAGRWTRCRDHRMAPGASRMRPARHRTAGDGRQRLQRKSSGR